MSEYQYDCPRCAHPKGEPYRKDHVQCSSCGHKWNTMTERLTTIRLGSDRVYVLIVIPTGMSLSEVAQSAQGPTVIAGQNIVWFNPLWTPPPVRDGGFAPSYCGIPYEANEDGLTRTGPIVERVQELLKLGLEGVDAILALLDEEETAIWEELRAFEEEQDRELQRRQPAET